MKTIASSVTMQDIADSVGVSVTTVSRAFNDSSKVALSTRDKIFKIAQDLDFHPNDMARSLSAGKSNMIAVILPDISNPFFTELLKYVEELCFQSKYALIFYNSNGDAKKETEIVSQMISRQIDGMLIALTVKNSSTIPLLKNAPFPVVVTTRTIDGIDSVGISHEEGGKLAANYMLSRGVSDFYYFGIENDEKFLGFKSVLLENNVPPENVNVIGNQEWYFKKINSAAMILKNFVRNKISSSKTGLFCLNDIYASYALIAAREASIQVPEHLCVVGFDDTMICEIGSETLTSIHQPLEEIAKDSFEILMHRISEGKDRDRNEFENIVLNPVLSVRNT